MSSARSGSQTLRQIVRQSGGLLQETVIEDEPDIKNRGFFFDVTRGRVLSLESLKRLADTMAFYKMNQLQLYVEHTYLFRDLTELWRDDTPVVKDLCLPVRLRRAVAPGEADHLFRQQRAFLRILGNDVPAGCAAMPDNMARPAY